MTEQAAEFTFGSWSTPQVDRTIEYPLEVMDEIRAAVCDGMQQLAHGGLEVGGVLFGSRRESSTRILTWRPIVCEHAHGPSLRFSPRDRIELARLLEVAKKDPDLEGLQPIGWFLSHARSDIFLSDSDLEIYNGFFPEPWQIALVLRPSRTGTARAGFFVREADGSLRSESSYQDFAVEPLHRPAPKESPSPPRETPLGRASIDQRTAPREAPEPVQIVEPPHFLTVERAPSSHGGWLWAIPATLALIIVGLLVKEKFLAPASEPFSFRVYDGGQTVQLEWDQNSPGVRDSSRAIVDVKDGTASARYTLTADQLHEGKMTYFRHSGDLEFRMTVYPARGPSMQEFARLLSAAGTIAPVSGGGAPPQDAGALKAERDRLEAELKRVKEELRTQRARADDAEKMVKILENRIAVDGARGIGPGAKDKQQ